MDLRLAEAVRDGQRLAAAMTLTFAVNGLPLGGSESVLAMPELPAGRRRTQVRQAFGRFLETLGRT